MILDPHGRTGLSPSHPLRLQVPLLLSKRGPTV